MIILLLPSYIFLFMNALNYLPFHSNVQRWNFLYQITLDLSTGYFKACTQNRAGSWGSPSLYISYLYYLEVSVCQASSPNNVIDDLELDDFKHHIIRKKSNLRRKQRYTFLCKSKILTKIVKYILFQNPKYL